MAHKLWLTSVEFLTIFLILPIFCHSQEDSATGSYLYPHSSAPSESEDVEDWPNAERIYDIDELEAYFGGPIKGRRFVAVDITSTSAGGKAREISYKFRTNERVKRESVKELKKDKKTHPDNLNEHQIAQLQKTPEGFNSSTIFYHFTQQLTELERIKESDAKIGDQCEAKTILEYDYCERAKYPNKNKMVCNKVNNSEINLVPNTCSCKFYRTTDTIPKWKQMKLSEISWNGNTVQACLVPAFGLCDHRQPTGILDKANRNIYEVDVCKGHYQCDNSKYMKYIKPNATVVDDKTNSTMLKVRNHCTEDDFLKMFEENVQSKILLCSKPHPRRFDDYDEFKYYCLPEKSRDPNSLELQKPPIEEADKDKDILFSEE